LPQLQIIRLKLVSFIVNAYLNPIFFVLINYCNWQFAVVFSVQIIVAKNLAP